MDKCRFYCVWLWNVRFWVKRLISVVKNAHSPLLSSVSVHTCPHTYGLNICTGDSYWFLCHDVQSSLWGSIKWKLMIWFVISVWLNIPPRGCYGAPSSLYYPSLKLFYCSPPGTSINQLHKICSSSSWWRCLPPEQQTGRVFVSNWFYSNQQLKIVSSSLHSERISSEKSKHFIQTNHDSLVFLYSRRSRRSRRLSAGCEGLPEEVLAASFPLSGGEQRAAAGGALQVDADVFGFTVSQREVLLFQSLVLHLQEVREEQLRQRGPRHVLKTRQDKKHE